MAKLISETKKNTQTDYNNKFQVETINETMYIIDMSNRRDNFINDHGTPWNVEHIIKKLPPPICFYF